MGCPSFRVASIVVAILVLPGRGISQEDPNVLNALRAALLEAREIERHERGGEGKLLILFDDHSQTDPTATVVFPEGTWSDATLDDLTRFGNERGIEVRACQERPCGISNEAWGFRFSMPRFADDRASVVVELHAPCWQADYEVILSREEGSWVTTSRESFAYGHYVCE